MIERNDTARLPKNPRFTDLFGQRFGRLVVNGYAGKSNFGTAIWNCACDCGGQSTVGVSNLKFRKTQSCGCIRREIGAVKNLTHGKTRTRTYITWLAAKKRCLNSNDTHFASYGGAGISICERWRSSFEAFLEDMGERPEGMTLDRWPNKAGNYEPSNCRWATPKEQANNRRDNIAAIVSGGRVSIPDLAISLGISYSAALKRAQRGQLPMVSRVERPSSELEAVRG